MKSRLTFSLLLLWVGFSLAYAQPLATPQNPPVSKRVIVGAENPELIDDFTAWRDLFDSLAASYSASGLDWYLDKRMRLKDVVGDAMAFESMRNAIATAATLATAEQENLKSQRETFLATYNEGLITASESDIRSLAIVRQEVAQLQKACEGLRASLLSALPETGETVWQKIVDFVDEDVKSRMVVHIIDEGPTDLEYSAIVRTFRVPRNKR